MGEFAEHNDSWSAVSKSQVLKPPFSTQAVPELSPLYMKSRGKDFTIINYSFYEKQKKKKIEFFSRGSHLLLPTSTKGWSSTFFITVPYETRSHHFLEEFKLTEINEQSLARIQYKHNLNHLKSSIQSSTYNIMYEHVLYCMSWHLKSSIQSSFHIVNTTYCM